MYLCTEKTLKCNNIQDDNNLLEGLEEADIVDGRSMIDILCYGDDWVEFEEMFSYDNSNTMAVNAYKYATMSKDPTTKEDKEKSEEKIRKAFRGGYNLKSDALQLSDVEKDKFWENLEDIAGTFGWSDKAKSAIKALPDSGELFTSESYVDFDPAKWEIKGSFVQIAGWQSAEDKTSVYVVTSTFGFAVPTHEREGTWYDKYLGGSGGTVSQEFIDDIKTVLRYKAKENGRLQLNPPIQRKTDL